MAIVPALDIGDKRPSAMPTKENQSGNIAVRKNSSVSVYLEFMWY
jgi:hypothetical protein